MLNQTLGFIKKFIPKKVFCFFQPAYHWLLVQVSALLFNYPSKKMIVIGVTGTAGKSSTCYFIAQILEQAGFKVGMTTTTLFKVAEKEWLNDTKMTMLGRFQLQNLLRKMVNKKCKIVIIETSSQGIEQFRHIGINYDILVFTNLYQFRHIGINYDILVFTNLYPEHIEAHGGFENYKKAKGKLFKYLTTTKNKQLTTNDIEIKKTIIVNGDDKHADYFFNFNADNKIKFNLDKNLETNILGEYNKYNVQVGIEIAKVFKIEENKVLQAIKNLKPMPGRLEFIKNNLGIKILVDYAYDPASVEKLYEAVKGVEHNKIIHVLGSAGGGRDKTRRPILGKIASENADVVIITNEDPYDENPEEIIDQVSEPVQKDKLFKLLDRREAIKKALELASKDDLILITGKGAEQGICVANGRKIKWDDRVVVREELKKIA